MLRETVYRTGDVMQHAMYHKLANSTEKQAKLSNTAKNTHNFMLMTIFLVAKYFDTRAHV